MSILPSFAEALATGRIEVVDLTAAAVVGEESRHGIGGRHA